MSAPRRYAIIGTGAIGGYYGARLQQSGCEVHYLLRSDYDPVRQQGLRVDSTAGDFMLPRVNAYSNPADIPPVDVVIIALKTTQNDRLTELLPPLQPETIVLTLQNGLGIESDIARQLPGRTILGGLCFICSNKIGPGHIRHLDYGQVLLGAYDASGQPVGITEIMSAIAQDFSQAQIPIDLTADLFMARWRKLVWNVPYNGLSVVLDATTDELMADSGTRALVETLMAEVVAAANAWGEQRSPGQNRTLPPSLIAEMLTTTDQMQPYRTSMKLDYDEGRPLEVEVILGNPVSAALQMGVAVPQMQMLYQQVRFLDSLTHGRGSIAP
ncbi:putative 2-dehydropantoate 2-reductase [Romeria aff. gracilis LEGE 07310]|uniref:2-dehydropantoate 2-reductase n=1 Tax=Vasconcelosia minhoensis LEGE 07310 TaxID=915328 RepID=A0A8J7DMD0_9CYAN|nr:putative 2-dehydropantoate 2-reductase [Romeria gracilis]MBE9076385.1 putative 2-dehydropantoate 2-reductase [Romeria aff. gracilis LEGE 07310]